MSIPSANNLLARLDRIPIWPFPYFVVVITGVGFFFAFFDIISIGLSLPIISKQLNISTDTGLWLISSGLIGYIFGALLDSIISDLFGRKLALLLSVAFFSVGSLLSATSPSFIWLLFWRFIIGMGIGSEIANVSAYIAELSPASCRGRVASIAICMGFLGFAAIPFVAMALIPNFSWGWRALFAIGGLGGVITFLARRHLPQSIRWHIQHNHLDTAHTILLQAEQLAEKRLKKPLPPLSNNVIYSENTESKNLFSKLFNRKQIGWITLFAGIWFVYYIGNYGWLTLSDELLVKQGFSLAKSLIMLCVTSLGFVVGCLIPAFYSDKIERKWLLVVICLIWATLLSLIGIFPHPLFILIAGFLASATISCLIPILYIYTAENFPTACRATGIAITDGVGHLGGAFCGQIIFGFANLTATFGFFKMAFFAMAVTGLLTAILISFGRKLTGKSLEQ